MLIFLAGLALLLALMVLGGRVGTHLFHRGEDPYFVRCESCERRYPRPAGVTMSLCPSGHQLAAPAAQHHDSVAGTVFVALCFGFAIAVAVLAATGHASLP